MIEEPKTLKTVSDVLDWAFDYLGIDSLCGVECGCDADDPMCDEMMSCCLGKRYPCDKEKCSYSCYSDYDAEFCRRETEITAPAKPQWSFDSPTEPGWYWVEPVFMFHKTPCKIRECETEGMGGTHFYLSVDLFGHPKERPLEFFIQEYPNARWLKIEEPEVPR